jgi:hypothetical protein
MQYIELGWVRWCSVLWRPDSHFIIGRISTKLSDHRSFAKHYFLEQLLCQKCLHSNLSQFVGLIQLIS